ncbi:hypothetical protein SODALDRAFT_329636 [Sodiomyces alkalinus F11]|uniref:Uncharacterized protein n=1 Tax=Sodiomyces alkalinus (strain CBS 110278 / VKM F-3762 / F11) TaxID=1314773 RepID=A0A3N2PK56_SODAK|nr:hypothetical protein SODALDRAFT_329636 [Sodiomyces alkalinus F11]ROT34764.1 hypothetical protein SODALDRAFT_329636 [Sodiomyces alkalinus F11]
MDKIKNIVQNTDKKDQEKQFTTQPVENQSQGVDPKFAAHQANPGPAMPQDFSNIKEEGTKEERRAKAASLNQK